MRAHRSALVAVVTAVATAVGVLGPAAPAAAVTTDQSYWVPITKTLTVRGHGYGHGHGMSQYGAEGAARQGLTYKQIADFYYPGTTWSAVRGRVRVLITADTTDDVVVAPASGLTVRDLATGATYPLPVDAAITRWRLAVLSGKTVLQRYSDGAWRIHALGTKNALAGDGEFFASTPLTLYTPAGARSYRGILRAASPAAGSAARDTVNIVSMDQYVMGVVPYEMPASWHPEAVKAQAIAARTYATWSRDQNPGRYYQICDTTRCQVYGGASGEDARSNAAVASTARQILVHGGKAAFTQFSSSSGGWTSAGSRPYLTAQADPYDGWAGNPVHSWSKSIDVRALERKYPSLGSLIRIRVVDRDGNGEWAGRVDTIVLDGTGADVTISGDSFRWIYGLRSNWFTIDPTPIIARWSTIGGTQSAVGRATTGEYRAARGAGQRFERGRIFFTPTTGAREVHGPILTTYLQMRGPASVLGFPKAPIRPIAGGRFMRFERGRIFVKSGRKGVALSGPIDRRFTAEGSLRAGLGWPTVGNYEVRGGQRADFERGYIVWVRSTGATRIVRL